MPFHLKFADLTVELIHVSFPLFARLISFIENIGGPFKSEIVWSSFKAARATLALNSALYEELRFNAPTFGGR
jgi:hypothetical protein